MTREQTTSASGGRNETNGGDRDQGRGELSSKSHEVAEQVRQAALDRVDSVRQNTQSAKQQAAERVRKLGATVRKVGEHLRVEDQHYVADKASEASQRLETFANYLNTAEISTIMRDGGNLARSNPAVFFGSAFVVGIATGRFLKAAGPSNSSSTALSGPVTTTSSPVTTTPTSSEGNRNGANR